MRYLAWVAFCATGLFLGLGAALLWAALIQWRMGTPPDLPHKILKWLAMSLAGVPQGVIAGAWQGLALAAFLPEVPIRRWIGATIMAATVGWAFGLAIRIFVVGGEAGVPAMEPGLMAAGAGFGAGVLNGALQGRALPGGARSLVTWSLGNAVGWALALPLIFLASRWALDLGGHPVAQAALRAGGGLMGGAAVGITTGLALLWLAAPARAAARAAE